MADSEKMPQQEGPPPAYNEMQQHNPSQPQMVFQGPPPGQPQFQPGPQYQQQQQVPQFQQPGPQFAQTAFAAQPGGTTVIVNQPMPGAPGAAPRMWKTGICSMCDDMAICCCGLFCGLCLSCSVSSDMGESYCVPFLVPAAEITLRTKWRTQENIQGSILDDCLTVWCCGPCAMCQLAREVKAMRNGTLHQRQQ